MLSCTRTVGTTCTFTAWSTRTEEPAVLPQAAGLHRTRLADSRDIFRSIHEARSRGQNVSRSLHILIYGPPAAGKRAVASALSESYDLKLLDNHLTSDVALRLFEFGSRGFLDLAADLRIVLARSAARSGLDVVSTMVFVPLHDQAFVYRLAKELQDERAIFVRVQLRPSKEVLEHRVTSDDRRTSQKLRDVDGLRHVLEVWDCYQQIDADDLSIDNSELPPAEVAAQIAMDLGLAPRR